MREVEFQALAGLLILLPGFVAARIVQSLTVRPQQTELDKVIEALLYSFVTYAVLVLTIGSELPISMVAATSSFGQQTYSFHARARGIGILAATSVTLGLAVSFLLTNDYSHRLLRKLRLTQRTTRSSVWSDTFHELGGVVNVELGDGKQVTGWLRYYSDEPNESSLFLERAAWVLPDGTLKQVEGRGMLITGEAKIRIVMFVNAATEHWERPAQQS